MTRSKTGRRPTRTAREVLDGKRAVEHSIPIAMESRWADAVADVEKEIEALDKRKRFGLVTEEIYQAEGAKLHEQLEAAQGDYEENSVVFVLRALGRGQLDRLVQDHKPSQDQLDAYQKLLDDNPQLGKGGELAYNTETLPPALLAATCLEPAFTLDEARELWESDSWSDAETATLLGACWSVNKLIK